MSGLGYDPLRSAEILVAGRMDDQIGKHRPGPVRREDVVVGVDQLDLVSG